MNWNSIAGIFDRINHILTPVWIGLILAYLLNPIMKLCEKYVFRFKAETKGKRTLKRALSMILTYLLVLIFLTLVVLLVLPQIINSIRELMSKTEEYATSTINWFNGIIKRLNAFLADNKLVGKNINTIEDIFNVKEFSANLTKLISDFTSYGPKILTYFKSLGEGFLNTLLGIFFSVYLLASKEMLIAVFKKGFRAVSTDKLYHSTMELCHFADKTFGGYIIGTLADSILMGILCSVVCLIFQIPYAVLIGAIVGITNVLPIIGPIIGAVPSAFIVLMVSPMKALWFIVIILVMQQIDGNIIVPKLLGQTTGVHAVWVLFSITFFGSLWGLFGMLIAVPLFAVIYTLLKIVLEKRLSKRGLPTGTEDYYPNPSDGETVHASEHSFASKIRSSSDQMHKFSISSLKQRWNDSRMKKKSKKK